MGTSGVFRARFADARRIAHPERVRPDRFLFTLGVTPMFLFSGVFFPLAGLPTWVQQVAWASPLYHLVEAFRALAIGTGLAGAALHAIWMLVVTLALWGLPSLVLRRRLRG